MVRVRSEARWLRFMLRALAPFPHLPDQSGYNKALRGATPLIKRLIRVLGRDTDLWDDPSCPVPASSRRRCVATYRMARPRRGRGAVGPIGTQPSEAAHPRKTDPRVDRSPPTGSRGGATDAFLRSWARPAHQQPLERT